jgi:hypothetical protein
VAKYEQHGVTAPEAEPPQEAEHVWGWFWALNAQRRSGPEALEYREVQAWSELTATPIRPIEVQMLMSMDGAFRAAVNAERAEQRKAKKDEPKPPPRRGRR